MNKSPEILKAALRLFSETGFHATSMRMIAKDANIVQSSIYNHFENKEALLVAIIKQMRIEIEETLRIDADLSKEEKIRKYRENLIESLKTKTEFWRLIHSIRMNQGVLEVIKPEMEEMQTMIIQNLSGIFSEGKNKANQVEMLLFWATIDGIVAAYLLLDKYPLEQVLAGLFSKYK